MTQDQGRLGYGENHCQWKDAEGLEKDPLIRRQHTTHDFVQSRKTEKEQSPTPGEFAPPRVVHVDRHVENDRQEQFAKIQRANERTAQQRV